MFEVLYCDTFLYNINTETNHNSETMTSTDTSTGAIRLRRNRRCVRFINGIEIDVTEFLLTG